MRTQIIQSVFALFLLFTPSAFAHKASDSYLTLRVARAQLHGEWHLALRDLNNVLDLDTDGDGAITWGELRAQRTAIYAYALSHLRLGEPQEPTPLRMTDLLVDNHSDGAYAVLRFTTDHPISGPEIQVQYRALFDLDRLHRGLLRLETPAGVRTAVFAPDTAVQRFSLDQREPMHAAWAFVREGIWHIWTGYDHILFLLALLLPGALRLSHHGWEPEGSFRVVLTEVLRIVTAFTVAHSITLSLAALGWVRVPSRLIECSIAASVVLAAANNIWPVFHGRAWVVAFVFGLVHGFGFANALADLGLHRGSLAEALLGFNLGVEVGQLAIVSVFLPMAFAVRQRLVYRELLLPVGSCGIALTAAVWFTERLFDVKWLPF